MGSLLWLKDHGFAETCVRSCRNCANFIRVQGGKDGKPSTNSLRGFCILGQGESDFGLYVSSTICGDCTGFMFDQTHALLTEEEQKISKQFYDFCRKEGPKIRREINKANRAIEKKTTMRWFFNWMEENDKLDERFRQEHLDELIAFRNKFELSWNDYLQFVDLIANFGKQYLDSHKCHLNNP